MKAVLVSALLLLGLMLTAFAQQRSGFVPRIEFGCGGSSVVIDSEPKGFRSAEEASLRTGRLVQAHITVTRGELQARFQNWPAIDYIGGRCIDDTQGNPRIVYQAFCGGSGQHCNNTSNWGIIDPIGLREILAPSPDNVQRASEILGMQPPLPPALISLLAGP